MGLSSEFPEMMLHLPVKRSYPRLKFMVSALTEEVEKKVGIKWKGKGVRRGRRNREQEV